MARAGPRGQVKPLGLNICGGVRRSSKQPSSRNVSRSDRREKGRLNNGKVLPKTFNKFIHRYRRGCRLRPGSTSKWEARFSAHLPGVWYLAIGAGLLRACVIPNKRTNASRRHRQIPV